EVVYKERDDSLEKAAITAIGLDAEQDRGNINKTQSKATPNEPSSPRTSSGGGPRRQETMGDTIAQTRYENVSKLSNDPLLARGNTLRSGEDSLKLQELMALCITLQKRVLDLETTKTTQGNEIASLKRRVKKLERRNRSRTHKLKRLYKVGLTARVESSEDKESLGEDASKQGRINAIDADEDITLVNDQDDADMFDVNTLTGDGVLAEPEVAVKDVNLSIDEVTLAQALTALKSAKVQEKEDVVEETSVPVSAANTKVSTATTTTTATIPTPRKGIIFQEPEPEKPMKKKELIRLDEEIDSKLRLRLIMNWLKDCKAQEQEELPDAEKATLFVQLLEKRRNHFVQKVDDVQETAEVKDDQEAAKIKELIEIVPDKEEVAIDVIPLATKPPSIVDWKIHKKGKKTYYQIIRVDGSSKMYLVFSHMLKSFDKEDLETLWKLVKAKHGSTRPEEGYERVL
ncbi:hypothetical protein Tco_0923710, partial [Tanacetum coccineum]